MKNIFAALIAGLLFGAGLTVSQMVNPEKILNFLDLAAIPDGGWDPSLALVMVAALIVTGVGYRLVLPAGRPLWAERFQLPTKTALDRPLIVGAVLFGAGWGLVGYCPGPAIASVVYGATAALIFVAALVAGELIYHFAIEVRVRPPS